MVLIVIIVVFVILFGLLGVYSSRNGEFIAQMIYCDPEKEEIAIKPVNGEVRCLYYKPGMDIPYPKEFVTVKIRHNKYLGFTRVEKN